MDVNDLAAFISADRDELTRRCKARMATMTYVPSSDEEIARGIPLFLDQLVTELRHDVSQTDAIHKTAVEHGHALFLQGFTVSQVVHDYGNVCQAVTDLALERAIPISTEDFRTLNRCLDDAIAGAVSEYARQQRLVSDDRSQELRTLIDTAITAFEALQSGSVGIAGATGGLVYRNLIDARGLVATLLFPVPSD